MNQTIGATIDEHGIRSSFWNEEPSLNENDDFP